MRTVEVIVVEEQVDAIQAAFDAEKAAGRAVVVLAPASVWPDRAVRGCILPDDPPWDLAALDERLRELDAAGYEVVIAAIPPALAGSEIVTGRARAAAPTTP